MKLLSVYQAILEYATMSADIKGFVHNKYGADSKEPVLIEGKQLVLPYSEQLRNFDPDAKMIFHPMAENIFKGESEVIKHLKERIMTKANISFAMIFQSLLNILASPDLHSQMNPQQAELFNMGMDADVKALANFTRIMTQSLKTKPDRGFISSYLNRGASYEGKRCTRVNVVSFPLYEQLTKEKPSPNGITIDHLRVKDRECFIKLYEFIFPDLEKIEVYNYGTNNTTAPYLDALLLGSTKITSRLNDLVELYGDYIGDTEKVLFSTDWYDDVKSMESLKSDILRIPVQYGSDGTLAPQTVVEQSQDNKTPVVNVSQMSTMPVAQSQRQAVAPVVKGKISFQDAVQSNGVAQQMQYPPQHMMPVGYPHQQPMAPVGYPQHQQPMMQPHPQQMQPQMYQQPMQQPMMQPMMQPQMYPQQMPMQPQMYQQPMQQPMMQPQTSMGSWPAPAAGSQVYYR
jgi:hypothetical protein